MPATFAHSLNKIEGVTVKGISIVNPKYSSFGDSNQNTWKIFDVYNYKRNIFFFIKDIILAEYYLCKSILWSDLIIWQWDAKIYLPHFWFLKFSKKPILVEWVGSDIRNPDILMTINPFYKLEFENKEYTYLKESQSRSIRIQKKFQFLKATPYLGQEMTLFLNAKLFPKVIITMQKINLKEYSPKYYRFGEEPIKLIHTPSAKGAKGTKFVRKAVDNLKSRYNIEYIEIHNKEHSEAVNAIMQADILLDQFVLGSYGIACCEALAMGKPVLCYLMDPIVNLLPRDCPIINANPNNLQAVLENIIINPKTIYEIGVKSRQYAEKYHDSDVLAKELIHTIENLFKLK